MVFSGYLTTTFPVYSISANWHHPQVHHPTSPTSGRPLFVNVILHDPPSFTGMAILFVSHNWWYENISSGDDAATPRWQIEKSTRYEWPYLFVTYPGDSTSGTLPAYRVTSSFGPYCSERTKRLLSCTFVHSRLCADIDVRDHQHYKYVRKINAAITISN